MAAVQVLSPKPVPAFHNDPFSPKLLDKNTKVADLTVEQERILHEIHLVSSSDTKFAQKATDAVKLLLKTVATKVPVVTSLSPNTKPALSPAFTLTVTGTDFETGAQIYVNGNAVPTTGSATSVTTEISLESVALATQIPVQVRNPSGVLSNTMTLTVTAVGG